MIALSWLDHDLGWLWLAAVALYALALLILSWRRRAAPRAPLRPIPLYDRLKVMLSRAVETDTPIHLALGSRGVPVAAPEISQAIELAAYAAENAGTAAHPLAATSGAPTLFVTAAAAGRGHRAGSKGERGAAHVRHGLLGVEGASYAVGAWSATTGQRLAGQVCFGPFGPEGLLLQEGTPDGAEERLAGAAELDAATLLMLASTVTAVGQDVYAAGEYLGRAELRAGLALQDGVRLILALGMLIGLGLRLAGVWGN